MDTIKKILVPLAFTDYSQGVFDCAVQVALKNDASLIVLSIINSRDIESVESIASMGYDVDAEHYTETIRRERKQKLNKMAEDARIDKDKVKILFKIGKPVDEILKVIHKEDPDLVVMGTRGRSSLKNSIMGVVAEKVFKKSPVTVLSYRDEDVKKSLEKKLRL
ncbi:MAG: universal stress protein [Desulfobacula sp.]|nr:universal stress protein [Desulfobacula sp.]